jgi:hypothetical protein
MTDSEHTGFSMGTGQGKSATARAVVEALTETWAPIPGAGYYEASDQAHDVYGIRSVDRTINGRFQKGQLLTAKKTGTSRYWQLKIRTDDGRERYATVHSLVLHAHVGLPETGQQACHADDDPDNNRLSNLRWDWPRANIDDRMRNSPAAPKPPKLCILCEQPFDTSGRRCSECREKIAKRAAQMLARGTGLQETADAVAYPPVPLLKLAQQLGGLRLSVTPSEPASYHAESPWRRLRKVINRREASRQNSDGA